MGDGGCAALGGGRVALLGATRASSPALLGGSFLTHTRGTTVRCDCTRAPGGWGGASVRGRPHVSHTFRRSSRRSAWRTLANGTRAWATVTDRVEDAKFVTRRVISSAGTFVVVRTPRQYAPRHRLVCGDVRAGGCGDVRAGRSSLWGRTPDRSSRATPCSPRSTYRAPHC